MAVLDIGRSKLTLLIHDRFGVRVDNLGFFRPGPTKEGWYFRYDLNETQTRERWRTDLPQYDIIVLAEVIEHLYTSPLRVLPFLHALLKPHGILIVQTPNAVALHQRVKMLLGRNPYTLINPDPTEPKHFREYTAQELRAFAAMTGFEVEVCRLSAYFDYSVRRRVLGGIAVAAYQCAPPSLRPGITMVWRRTSIADSLAPGAQREEALVSAPSGYDQVID